jgi:hypothetical protein
MTIQSLGRRAYWTLSQAVGTFFRDWSKGGITLLVLSLFIISVGLWQLDQQQRLRVLRASVVNTAKLPEFRLPVSMSVAQDLEKFQNYLLPHGDIPDTLRDLIMLAQDQQLLLARGEYKSQVDARGQFLRYQMTLPVQGDAKAVEKFILSALAQHKTLSLDSVQFKRERIESKDVEAKIEWTLLTKSPATGLKP